MRRFASFTVLIIIFVCMLAACTKAFDCRFVTMPTIAEYYLGDDLSLEGGQISVSVNGTETLIDLPSEFVVASRFDNTVLGKQNVVLDINYQGYSKQLYFAVEVKALAGKSIPPPSVTLDELRVKAFPHKTNYYEGETADFSGLEIEYLYSDGSTVVAHDYSVSPVLDKELSIGDNIFVFTSQGKSCSVCMTAAQREVDSVNQVSAPSKTTYIAGESFAPAGFSAMVEYVDGTSLEVSWDAFEFDYTVFATASDNVSVTATLKADPTKTLTIEGLQVEHKTQTINLNSAVTAALADAGGGYYVEVLDCVEIPIVLSGATQLSTAVNQDYKTGAFGDGECRSAECSDFRVFSGKLGISLFAIIRYSNFTVTTSDCVYTLTYTPMSAVSVSVFSSVMSELSKDHGGSYVFTSLGLDIYDYVVVKMPSAFVSCYVLMGNIVSLELSYKYNDCDYLLLRPNTDGTICSFKLLSTAAEYANFSTVCEVV